MTNFYLLQSEIKADQICDILIDLDKVFTIRVTELADNEFCLALDYTEHDAAKIWFKTRESTLAEINKIVTKLGLDPSIADNFVFGKVTKPKDQLVKLLNKVKEEIEEAC